MKISGFLRQHKYRKNESKIFMMQNPVFMRVERSFLTRKKPQIRQAYIGGEDFGFHRAGNKHIILVCDVQRRPQRMYCFDERRDVRSATVISVNSVQQKQSQYKDDSVRSRTFAESRFRF